MIIGVVDVLNLIFTKKEDIMKIRQGFVSNSSSTAFIIFNKSINVKSLVDFVEENYTLVDDFNEQYDNHFEFEQLIEDAKYESDLKPGENYCVFGDEEGTALGHAYDYILRGGGESTNFQWWFKEYLR